MGQIIELPPLREGELYLGGFVNESGSLVHSILMPGEIRQVNWFDAMEWAKSQGGDLPTRIEITVAFTKHRGQVSKYGPWAKDEDDDLHGFSALFGLLFGRDGIHHLQYDHGDGLAVRRVEVTSQ